MARWSPTRWLLTAVLMVGGAAVYAQTATDQKFDLDAHWKQPLKEQGEPPAGWSDVERSLQPADCGQCHAAVFAQWRTSRHAQAFSVGFVAQLAELNATEAAECLECHAPLAEQRQAFEAARARGVTHKADQLGLAAAGNSCGGCHLRQHRRFGPPQRGSMAVGASTLPAPHGGVFRTDAFERAEFCSACHQFSADLAVNGKPLQNTYVEWRASPQAAQGLVCQSCHMPDRAHLWRGIHDPAMVEKGLTPNATADKRKARFEIKNTGVGHAFPTYTVPTAVLAAVALDANGAALPKTLRTHVIARRVHHNGKRWVELSDTRLLPGRSAAIELPWNGHDRARVWLEVIPDDHYATQIFPELTQTLTGEARELAVQALATASSSRFRLFETELRRP